VDEATHRVGGDISQQPQDDENDSKGLKHKSQFLSAAILTSQAVCGARRNAGTPSPIKPLSVERAGIGPSVVVAKSSAIAGRKCVRDATGICNAQGPRERTCSLHTWPRQQRGHGPETEAIRVVIVVCSAQKLWPKQ
jgi:hypothetical protein